MDIHNPRHYRYARTSREAGLNSDLERTMSGRFVRRYCYDPPEPDWQLWLGGVVMGCILAFMIFSYL